METGSGQSCCSMKGSCKYCKGGIYNLIFKLAIVGLLTCIASSLWQIDKGIALHGPTTSAKP